MNDFLNGQVKNDGFLRVAAASPKIRVADAEGNAEVALAAVREAAEHGVRALVLPELNLCGYTAADLFHNRTLLHACETALAHILDETRELPIVFTIGLPVAVAENNYNCAAVCCSGELLGLTAKKYLPNYASSMSAVGLLRRLRTPCGLNLPVRVRSRWVRGLSTVAVMRAPRTWCWALKSVRTCGCRHPLRPRWRLPVRR